MRTTVMDVFDEESKSELRIGLPCKGKPKNAENCGKIPSAPKTLIFFLLSIV